MNVITSNIKFNGLYSWGKGWENMLFCKRWNEFWDSKEANGIFWSSFKKNDFNNTRYLVTTGGSIYLHPMTCSVVIRCLGESYSFVNGVRVETFPEMEELYSILSKCCEYCGADFEMDEIKKFEIN